MTSRSDRSVSRRRGIAVVALSASLVLGVVACGPDEQVSNISSEDLDSTPSNPSDPTRPTDPSGLTDPTTPPDFTVPPQPTQPTTFPTENTGTVSNSLPRDTSTGETVDVSVPPDCVELPDDAPSILVTDDAGVVYQVGSDGTQIIADSEDLPSTIATAWRAKGGTLWVTLNPSVEGDSSVGRLDASGYTEVASGAVNVQHIGVIDDVPVALWFDYGSLDSEGRAVVEDAEGKQSVVLDSGTDGDYRIATGGLGGNSVAINEESPAGQRFRFFDAKGKARKDWFNPTDEHGADPEPPRYIASTPSPDGKQISWLEEPNLDLETGEAEGKWQLVVASSADGTESYRETVAKPDESLGASDFDGRWYLLGFTSGTRLVDVTRDGAESSIVPCIPAGSATLDRGGGGGSEPPPTTPPPTTAAPTTASPTTVESGPGGTVPGGTDPGVDP